MADTSFVCNEQSSWAQLLVFRMSNSTRFLHVGKFIRQGWKLSECAALATLKSDKSDKSSVVPKFKLEVFLVSFLSHFAQWPAVPIGLWLPLWHEARGKNEWVQNSTVLDKHHHRGQRWTSILLVKHHDRNFFRTNDNIKLLQNVFHPTLDSKILCFQNHDTKTSDTHETKII